MDFSKIKKISFILLILFILLFPFWCVRGLCAEPEEVSVSTVNGITITPNNNFFTSSAEYITVGYFELEKGYKYTINIPDSFTTDRYIALSNSIPALNVTYDFLTSVQPGDSYSFIANDNNTYLYFTFSSNNEGVTVIREKLESMNGAVSDLVSNVGIESIWNIFDISINYIVVVVLFAFGAYIIFRIIRKISKGKEGL